MSSRRRTGQRGSSRRLLHSVRQLLARHHFLIRTATAPQEAESFPAIQIWGLFLGFLGCSSWSRVFCWVLLFPLFSAGCLSPQQRTKRAGCRERVEPAACALPQADQKTGKLHSTQHVDRSGVTFLKGEACDLHGADAMGAEVSDPITSGAGDGRPECKCESERGAMISRGK